MIRGLWSRETVALLLSATSLPLAVAWLHYEGFAAVPRFALVLLCIGVWQLAWLLARAQPPSAAGLVTALAVAILSPQDLGILPLLLGLSFGIAFGELAFGGWGRNILHPATVTLAFIGFGFPAAPWPELPIQVGWAAFPVGGLAILFGIVPARLLSGAVASFAAGAYFDPGLLAVWPAAAIVLVLLVGDPVASASTPFGHWLSGILYAALVALFHATWTGAAAAQMAVSAALLVSLAAPLIDEAAVTIWLARRRRRLG